VTTTGAPKIRRGSSSGGGATIAVYAVMVLSHTAIVCKTIGCSDFTPVKV